MVHSVCNDSDDENLSIDSHLSNDGYNVSGSSNRAALKKGPWTSSEDAILVDYVKQHGEGNWNAVQKHTELSRCGKSCRLRWANHLRPNLKKGAFTLEEEQLIIELHAKIGNKWARMAAQLPGRTDNEIKNYWNTRIKRRTRAGLPLYPPELSLQAQPQSLHNLNSPGIYGGDQGYGDMLQSNNYQTPDLIFDSLTGLPYRAGLPDTCRSASMTNGFGPQFCTFVPQSQRYDEDLDKVLSEYDGCAAYPLNRNQSESYGNKVIQSFGLGLPYDPDKSNKVVTVAAYQDSHFMPNGISSASLPSIGVEKFELPSFQYQDTCLGVWDPAPKSLDYLEHSPSYPSRGSSGLLDDLLYEATALRKTGNKLSESSNKTNSTCLPELKGYPLLTSQLDDSTASNSNGYNQTEHHAKSEMGDGSWMLDIERKEIAGGVNYSRPDALLGSCWFTPSYSPPSKEYEDMGNVSAETSACSWGALSSCTWNNMPPVCQMSDLP